MTWLQLAPATTWAVRLGLLLTFLLHLSNSQFFSLDWSSAIIILALLGLTFATRDFYVDVGAAIRPILRNAAIFVFLLFIVFSSSVVAIILIEEVFPTVVELSRSSEVPTLLFHIILWPNLANFAYVNLRGNPPRTVRVSGQWRETRE